MSHTSYRVKSLGNMKLKTVTLWHHDTSQHTVSDTQTEGQWIAKRHQRKVQGYVVTATRGRSEREKRSHRCRAENSFLKDMLREYTNRYSLIGYVLSCDSLQAEEKDRGKRQIKRGEDYSARRGQHACGTKKLYRKPKTQRSHVKARATVH